ncbi:MAG: hypothetical protein KC646_06675 [Candidatus Cloacimonetes bacterium]|nr:hypothetical protein [Candidatus Cloacimonadota bacterium]
MENQNLKSLKESSYVLIFLFFVCPPLGILYYCLYGSKNRSLRIACVTALIVILYLCSGVLKDLYRQYHNKMWYKISTRMTGSFQYKDALDFFSKQKFVKDREILLFHLSKFNQQKDLPSYDKEIVTFDQILEQSNAYYKNKLSKSVRSTPDVSSTLGSFLLHLELPPVVSKKSSKISKQIDDFPLYVDLFETSLLLSRSKQQSDQILEQVMSLRTEYNRYWLQSLLIHYFLLYRSDEIIEHPKLISDLNDYVSQGSGNLFAYYSRGQYHLLMKDYQAALYDFLHVFKYQTRYFDVFEKIKVCLKSLNQEKDMYVVSQYRLSEDLRFTREKIDESLEVSANLLNNPSDVYSKLKVENLHNRGHSLKNIVKDYDKARKHFLEIVSLDEKERKEEAYYNLIMIELHTKNFEACEKYILYLNEEFPMTHHRDKTNFIRLYLSIMSTVKGQRKADEVNDSGSVK